nr:MAG TPA_asm: hypothetical protein [Caudoviricetes sp.]
MIKPFALAKDCLHKEVRGASQPRRSPYLLYLE